MSFLSSPAFLAEPWSLGCWECRPMSSHHKWNSEANPFSKIEPILTISNNTSLETMASCWIYLFLGSCLELANGMTIPWSVGENSSEHLYESHSLLINVEIMLFRKYQSAMENPLCHLCLGLGKSPHCVF